MLPFLADPQRFIQGLIATDELRALRQQRSPGRIRLAILLYAVALFIAALPFVIYMGLGQGTLFKLIATTVVLGYGAVSLHPIILTVQAVTREKHAGTGDAQEFIIGKWWSVLSCVWPEYIIAALLKVGVAYGLAEYFYITNDLHCSQMFGPTLCRSTMLWGQFAPYQAFPLNTPPFYSFIAALIFLLIFSLLDAVTMIALALSATILTRHRLLPGIALSLVLRGLPCIMILVVWSTINQIMPTPDVWISNFAYADAKTVFAFPFQTEQLWDDNNVAGALHDYLAAHDWQAILETAQISITPLADSGVTLATDTMRPASSHLHFIERLLSVGIGFGLYVAFLWLSLRAGVILAVRDGFGENSSYSKNRVTTQPN